ncbi:MAG TPA: carboxypeptidase-like regulatory domain-containing protein [Blastocatellia bacterium]|nr:carboxypeptidase-like regulatory domain-containing protein [Blastocatellia bacterium]
MKLSKRMISLTVACVALCGAIVFGQTTSGVISGTMLDPQGAALDGATVKIKNVETGATRETKTDSNGFYRVTG